MILAVLVAFALFVAYHIGRGVGHWEAEHKDHVSGGCGGAR